jgi:hypothetical protein
MEQTFSFGDRVKVKSNDITVAKGLDNKVGSVTGWSTPSMSGVDVLGGAADDFAISVLFDEFNGKDKVTIWFNEDHLEFVDYGVGQSIWIGNTVATRSADGSWVETVLGDALAKKPWWKFWA